MCSECSAKISTNESLEPKVDLVKTHIAFHRLLYEFQHRFIYYTYICVKEGETWRDFVVVSLPINHRALVRECVGFNFLSYRDPYASQSRLNRVLSGIQWFSFLDPSNVLKASRLISGLKEGTWTKCVSGYRCHYIFCSKGRSMMFISLAFASPLGIVSSTEILNPLQSEPFETIIDFSWN